MDEEGRAEDAGREAGAETIIRALSELDGERVARLFHDTYERLAPQFGYETRPDTKAFDPDTPNGKLMVAVATHMKHYFVGVAAVAKTLL